MDKKDKTKAIEDWLRKVDKPLAKKEGRTKSEKPENEQEK